MRDDGHDEQPPGQSNGLPHDGMAIDGTRDTGGDPWSDACLTAALFAIVPPDLGGVILKASAGPVRDTWMALVRRLLPDAAPLQRLPLHITQDRLLGGLDLAATLATGRRVLDHGALSQADGGVAVVAMAERWSVAAAAQVAQCQQQRAVAIERDGLHARTVTAFGIIALDESGPDEAPPPAILSDGLAIHMDLTRVAPRAAVASSAIEASDILRARALWPAVGTADDATLQALCATAAALGIGSLRAPLLALNVARAHAALCGRITIEEADIIVGARLVLVPRATQLPAPSEAEAPSEPQSAEPPEDQQPDASADTQPADNQLNDDQPNDDQQDAPDAQALQDLILAAALASIPPGLLDSLKQRHKAAHAQSATDGQSGVQRASQNRGRVTGVRAPRERNPARLNLLATLSAAAPFQKLRQAEHRNRTVGAHQARKLYIRASDFRVSRYQQTAGSTIVFAVDASGSSALNRLAEAKGAVELLLADCYARRDRVGLVSFRGRAAELLLAPSRSLARAKRSLAGLPGGGGTPLALGLDAALAVAIAARRKGDTPLIVLLTDGRANVNRSGVGGRPEAEQQSLQAGRDVRAAHIGTMLVDTSVQPHPFAKKLAAEMGGRYLPLPMAGAHAISAAVQRERQAEQSAAMRARP